LYPPLATVTQAGIISLGTQSFIGTKTFTGVTNLGDGTTNYSQFSTSGHQTMVGNARPWRDEPGQLILMKIYGTRIADNVTEGTVDFATNCTTSDWKITSVQLNHDKDLSASIYPHIHWLQSTANVPNWLLQYRWQINGQAEVTGWTSLTCNTTVFTYSSGSIMQVCEALPIVVPAGTGLSDIVQFRIIRDNANASGLFSGADPVNATVSAFFFDLHFMTNSIGSTLEYTK
jgi:hypothetical protein